MQCSQSLPRSHVLSLFPPDRSQEGRLSRVIEHQNYIKLPTWLKKRHKQTNKKEKRQLDLPSQWLLTHESGLFIGSS